MKRILALILIIWIGSCKKESAPAVPGPEITSFTPTKGAYNNIVSIYGRRFDSTMSSTKVFFNGLEGTVRHVEDTLIVALVPLNVTTGKIKITVASGSTTTVEDFVVFQGKWTRKADFPGQGRSIASGFSIGTKGYILGGADPGMTLNDFWEYDQSTDKWTKLTDPGFYSENALAQVVGGKAYIGVGYDRALVQGGFKTWQVFDPASNKWTRKTDFPGLARDGAISLVHGGKIYVGLGWNRVTAGDYLHDWWAYDPTTDTWTRKADNPWTDVRGMYMSTGFTLGDSMFLGASAYGVRDWWIYEPLADKWAQQPHLQGGFYFKVGAFTLNGKGYLAGSSTECWEYDPGSKAWRQMAFFGVRNAGTTFTIGNKAYYATGDFLQELWEFDPNP